MGAPLPPFCFLPDARLQFVETVILQPDPTIEIIEVYHMTDTDEWIVMDDGEAEEILETHPGAKILIAPDLTEYRPGDENQGGSNELSD